MPALLVFDDFAVLLADSARDLDATRKRAVYCAARIIRRTTSIRKEICDMRSERRHELQHNELADWLFTAGQRIKPYQNAILAAVVGIVVLIVAWSWWSRSSAAQTAQAWTDLTNGMEGENLDALTRVIEAYPNTNVAHVATILVADTRLAQGCEQRFINRAVATKELSSAVTSYSAVLEQCRTPSLLERATFGLARAKEAQGDLEAAKKNYEIVAKWPDGTYAAAASQRLDDLNQRETKLMFDDLCDPNFNPNPSFSNEAEPQGPTPRFEQPAEPPTGKPATKVDDKKPATKVDNKKPEKGEVKKK